MNLTISMEELQDALVKEKITLNQFIEVLIDNFGMIKTRQILEHNLKLAMKKDSNHIERYG